MIFYAFLVSGLVFEWQYTTFCLQSWKNNVFFKIGLDFWRTLQHFFLSMCKRRNTSASRVLFWSNTTTLFCIDVQTAQYIRKSGATLKQHYITFLWFHDSIFYQHYNMFCGMVKNIQKQYKKTRKKRFPENQRKTKEKQRNSKEI